MRIAVLVKQTFSTDARIELDGSGKIQGDKVKKVVNPYDEFAVEEAILLKERGLAENVTTFTFGPPSAQETIRQCLAMGADESILIDNTGCEEADSSIVAAILAAAIQASGFDLVLAGFTAVDDNAGQVAVRVAEILGIPQISVVSKMEVGSGTVTGWREADGRTEVLEAPLPALVTADKSLNKPRYPTLPNIMKAKKKPLEIKKPSDYGVDAGAGKTSTLKYELPPAKTGAKIFSGPPAEAAAQLVSALRNEAKVV